MTTKPRSMSALPKSPSGDQQLEHRLAADLERDAQQRAPLGPRQLGGTLRPKADRGLFDRETGGGPA
jgi:hypothetical protein